MHIILLVYHTENIGKMLFCFGAPRLKLLYTDMHRPTYRYSLAGEYLG